MTTLYLHLWRSVVAFCFHTPGLWKRCVVLGFWWCFEYLVPALRGVLRGIGLLRLLDLDVMYINTTMAPYITNSAAFTPFSAVVTAHNVQQGWCLV